MISVSAVVDFSFFLLPEVCKAQNGLGTTVGDFIASAQSVALFSSCIHLIPQFKTTYPGHIGKKAETTLCVSVYEIRNRRSR